MSKNKHVGKVKPIDFSTRSKALLPKEMALGEADAISHMLLANAVMRKTRRLLEADDKGNISDG